MGEKNYMIQYAAWLLLKQIKKQIKIKQDQLMLGFFSLFSGLEHLATVCLTVGSWMSSARFMLYIVHLTYRKWLNESEMMVPKITYVLDTVAFSLIRCMLPFCIRDKRFRISESAKENCHLAKNMYNCHTKRVHALFNASLSLSHLTHSNRKIRRQNSMQKSIDRCNWIKCICMFIAFMLRLFGLFDICW